MAERMKIDAKQADQNRQQYEGFKQEKSEKNQRVLKTSVLDLSKITKKKLYCCNQDINM